MLAAAPSLQARTLLLRYVLNSIGQQSTPHPLSYQTHRERFCSRKDWTHVSQSGIGHLITLRNPVHDRWTPCTMHGCHPGTSVLTSVVHPRTTPTMHLPDNAGVQARSSQHGQAHQAMQRPGSATSPWSSLLLPEARAQPAGQASRAPATAASRGLLSWWWNHLPKRRRSKSSWAMTTR
jgi:hypothetical protein